MGMKIKTGLVMLALCSCAYSQNIKKQSLADFVGGVYGTGGVIIGKGTAITPNGIVTATGSGFITPTGYYASSGGQTWGADRSVTQSGNIFWGSSGVRYREGQTYFDSNGEADYVVLEPVVSRGVSSTMRTTR